MMHPYTCNQYHNVSYKRCVTISSSANDKQTAALQMISKLQLL